ncbi:MAG: diguanylate cyclase [Alkalispirochaeta sp.]
MKFSTRLFLVIFLVNSVTAIISTSLFLTTFREGEYADLERNMELVATVAAARYTSYLDRAQAILEVVATDSDVRRFFVDHEILREYSRNDARRYLGQVVESNPSISDIVLSSGEEQISMIGCGTDERSQAGSYVLSCDGERGYALLSSPAGPAGSADPSDPARPSVRVDLLVDLQRFADTRVAPLLEEGGRRLALVGPDGTPLAVTGASLEEGREWVEQQGLSAAIVPDILDRHQDNYTFRLQCGDLGFILVSPVSDSNERLVTTSRWALVTVILLIIVPGLPALLLSRTLGKRLRELAHASRLLDGRTEVDIDTTGSDEVAELSRALVDLDGRVNRSTGELEERVRQRTEVIERQKRELVRLNQELAEMASHDPLTALFNRRAFEEQAHNLFALARRESRWLGVAMIDVDYFKSVNDHYGHQVGDDTLRALAALFTESFRRETDLIGRYGGEEFAIVTTTARGDGEFVARLEEFRATLAATPIPTNTVVVHVTVSCGAVVTIPTSDDAIEGILNDADQALYHAKEQGRNRVILADSAVHS